MHLSDVQNFFIPEPFAADVVDENNVHLTAGPGGTEVRGVLRDGRAEGTAREQADEDAKVLDVGYELLDAD
jgi:hypothetical protein